MQCVLRKRGTMKADDVISRSIFIITEYYENNLEPFFESIGEDVLWLGPAKRQYIQGKQKLIDTWMAESHNLTFTMGDIEATCASPAANVQEVLLHYEVSTHYPSGKTFLHDQLLHFPWRERRVKHEGGGMATSRRDLAHPHQQFLAIRPARYHLPRALRVALQDGRRKEQARHANHGEGDKRQHVSPSSG